MPIDFIRIWFGVAFVILLPFGFNFLIDIYKKFKSRRYEDGFILLLVFWVYLGIMAFYYSMFLM